MAASVWLRTLIDRCQVAGCSSVNEPLIRVVRDMSALVVSVSGGLIAMPEQVIARNVIVRTVRRIADQGGGADAPEILQACVRLAVGTDLRPDSDLALARRSVAIVDSRVKRTLEMIRARFADRKFTIRAAARDKNVNVLVRTLTRLLNLHTHSRFSEHVRRARFNKAQELLETTTLSVKEITNVVGFANESQFVREFRHSVGLTPRQFRLRSIHL
jgi:transcriptional regulator GlxA family with amidase domain